MKGRVYGEIPSQVDPGTGSGVGHVASYHSLGSEGNLFFCSREGPSSHHSDRLSLMKDIRKAQCNGSC